MKFKGNVLVTGGAGYIGKEVSLLLQLKGYKVTILDKKYRPDWVSNMNYIQGDITDMQSAVAGCANQDYVIHLAAKPRIPESFVNPNLYFLNNVIGTQNMLAAASSSRIKKFVYASSSSVYGNNPAPHKPYHKPDPLNYYAMTKLFGEHLCKQFKNMYGLNYNILRFFTVYSENQPDTNEGGLMIAKFARLAKEGEPLTVHGDGEYRRDFIHISDVSRAVVASMESKVKSEIFNVGTGTNVSVNEVVDILRRFVPDLVVAKVDNPKGYAKETLADISKANKLLGWKPKVEIKSGIEDTYKNIFGE